MGNRVIDTVLDPKSAAYPSVQSGKEYSGDVVILGKNYIGEYRPLFASGGKDVIGILFVGPPVAWVAVFHVAAGGVIMQLEFSENIFMQRNLL